MLKRKWETYGSGALLDKDFWFSASKQCMHIVAAKLVYLLFDHVLEQEVRDDRDCENLSTLINDLGDVLVLQSHHILTVDLKIENKMQKRMSEVS